MQSFQYIGKWWLPSDEDNQISGTLTFSTKTGSRLSLEGSFRDVRAFPSYQTHLLILGVTRDGKLISLYECQESNSHQSYPGYASEDYNVRITYVGAHFLHPDRITFHKATVEYAYLLDWMQHTGFTSQPTFDQNSRLKSQSVTYTTTNPTKIVVVDGIIDISDTVTIHDVANESTLRQSARIIIEPNEPLSFEQLMSTFVVPLQNFLSLATSRPNAIAQLHVSSKDIDDWGDMADLNLIEVFFRPIFSENTIVEQLDPSDMLFTLKDVGEACPEIIERWFKKAKELDTVQALFFGAQYNPSFYLESRFLTSIQAAEIYHRLRGTNQVIAKTEFKRRRKAILATVTEEFKEWLQGILSTISNEPRLRQRILELLDISADIIGPLISSNEEFAKEITNTRNYYTHYSEESKGSAVTEPQELYRLTETLYFLLQRCLLQELGFSSDQCMQFFQRNRRYQFALRRFGKPNMPGQE